MPNSRARLHDAPRSARRHSAPAPRSRRRARPRTRCGTAAPARRRTTVSSAAAMYGNAALEMSCWRIDDAAQHVARARPGDRELRPLLGHRARTARRAPATAPGGRTRMCCITLAGVGRGGRHEEAVVGEARGGAVVHHEAVLAQHHAVARPADRQGGAGVDVEAVEERAGVRPLHVDLAERRDVADADRRAHRAHLAVDASRASRVSPAAEPLRAQPRPGLDEHGALLLRPGVRRRAAASAGSPCRDGGPANAPIATGV